jgi:hypothetical protein
MCLSAASLLAGPWWIRTPTAVRGPFSATFCTRQRTAKRLGRHGEDRPLGGTVALAHGDSFPRASDGWKGKGQDTGCRPGGKQLDSRPVLTTDANAVLRPIHNRMPACPHRSRGLRPLVDLATAPEDVQALLRQFPAEGMESFPVSTLVNSPRNDSPKCWSRLRRSPVTYSANPRNEASGTASTPLMRHVAQRAIGQARLIRHESHGFFLPGHEWRRFRIPARQMVAHLVLL